MLGVLIAAFAVTGCSTDTKVRLIEKSMEPTIRSGEYANLDEYAYNGDEPVRRGDIISFKPPAGIDDLSCQGTPAEGAPCDVPAGEGDGASLIKRVIALPGETVAIADDGRAVVDGATLDEPQIIECKPEDECELPEEITVPDDTFFVMGDNRPYSGDSRDFGPIEAYTIEGRITPPER
jgi:signal peptidase I